MLDAIWFVLAGMAVVFAALALLMVAMMALNRLAERPEAGGGEGSASPPSPHS